jgi:hypothetical protein
MSMTPSGIEPATFRFVAQYLNHCATAVPNNVRITVNIRDAHCRKLGLKGDIADILQWDSASNVIKVLRKDV